MRDERTVLITVLERAGLTAAIDDAAGFPSARFSCGFPDIESASFFLDAPSGWLRVSTTIEVSDLAITDRANLGLLYLQTGLGHCHYDAANKILRIAASLPAVSQAPIGSALIATLQHLASIRQTITTGRGSDVRSVIDATPLPGEPPLPEVARVVGKSLAIVEEKDGSFAGALHEPRSDLRLAFRMHTAGPGIFAFDAWLLPPTRTEPSSELFERLDRFNTTLTAGALLLSPWAGMLVYRWACPYRWLDLTELATPVMAHTALDGFLRWQAS